MNATINSKQAGLSQAFTIQGYNPFKRANAAKKIKQLLFKHYVGSHVGYGFADKLLKDKRMEPAAFDAFVKSWETVGPRKVFERISDSKISQDALFREFQRESEDISNKRLGKKLLAGTVALAGVTGLFINNQMDKIKSRTDRPAVTATATPSAGRPPATPTIGSTQRPASAGITTARESKNFFVDMAQRSIEQDQKYRDIMQDDLFIGALTEGRSGVRGWLNRNGTVRPDAQADVQKESARIKKELDAVRKKLGDKLREPIQTPTAENDGTLDPYVRVAKEMGFNATDAHTLAMRVAELQRKQGVAREDLRSQERFFQSDYRPKKNIGSVSEGPKATGWFARKILRKK